MEESGESYKSLLTRGACRLTNNGEGTLIWEDPWIPNLPTFKPTPKHPECKEMCLVVSQLFKEDGANLWGLHWKVLRSK